MANINPLMHCGHVLTQGCYLDARSRALFGALCSATHLSVTGYPTATAMIIQSGDEGDAEAVLKIALIVQGYVGDRELYDGQFLQIAPIILGYAGMEEDGFNLSTFASELACRLPRESSVLRHLEPTRRREVLATYHHMGARQGRIKLIEAYQTLTCSVDRSFQVVLNTIRHRNHLSAQDRAERCLEVGVRDYKQDHDCELFSLLASGPLDRGVFAQSYLRNAAKFARRMENLQRVSEYPFLSNMRLHNMLRVYSRFFQGTEEEQWKSVRALMAPGVNPGVINRLIGQFNTVDLQIEFIALMLEHGATLNLSAAVRTFLNDRSPEGRELVSTLVSALSEKERDSLLCDGINNKSPATDQVLIASSGPIPLNRKGALFIGTLNVMDKWGAGSDHVRMLFTLYDPKMFEKDSDELKLAIRMIKRMLTKWRDCTKGYYSKDMIEQLTRLLQLIREDHPSESTCHIQ